MKVMESAIKKTSVNEDANQDKKLLDLLKTFESSLKEVGDAEFELSKNVTNMRGYVDNMLKTDKPVDGKGILNKLNPLTSKLETDCNKMWKDCRNALEALMNKYR